ncbi:MAG: hypothetical protein QXD89_00590 [Candidatus Aenigmatarchaeota archaeon]
MKKLLFLSEEAKIRKVTRIEISSYLKNFISDALPKIKSKEIFGSSPPEVFVGRFGYPKVFVGPMISPLENSDDLLYTEKWYGRELEEIFKMRFQVIRGKFKAKINELNNKEVEKLQELILSKNSVEMEAKFKNAPRGFSLSFDHQPFGPSAYVEEFKIKPNNTDFKIEKIFYDEMKTKDAVFWLYTNKVPISKIQQAFSIGMIGIKRKMVPTRWSITAIDDIIGRKFLEKVKEFPTINEFRVYHNEYLNNKWIILMFPSYWQYESIEIWYPGTLENNLAIGSDYEGFEFKKEYASIGGCWYAARAMVAEKLFREKKQAGVLIVREIYPKYIPVGVWNVRETIRNTLNLPFEKFDSLEKAITYMRLKINTPFKVIAYNSMLLRKINTQTKITNFV